MGWLISAGCSLSKMFGDDTASRGMDPGIGDIHTPLLELGIQIIEIAKAPGEVKILADVPIGSLDLALHMRISRLKWQSSHSSSPRFYGSWARAFPQ